MHVRKRCSADRVPKCSRKEFLIVGLSGEQILFKKAREHCDTARRMDLEGEIVLFYFSPSRRGHSREVSDRTSVSGVGPGSFSLVREAVSPGGACPRRSVPLD